MHNTQRSFVVALDLLLFIILLVPVCGNICPAGHMSLATKLTHLAEVAGRAVALLPLADDKVIGRGDKLSVVGPAEGGDLAGVAAGERRAGAKDGDG